MGKSRKQRRVWSFSTLHVMGQTDSTWNVSGFTCRVWLKLQTMTLSVPGPVCAAVTPTAFVSVHLAGGPSLLNLRLCHFFFFFF